jgi:cytochrome c553
MNLRPRRLRAWFCCAVLPLGAGAAWAQQPAVPDTMPQRMLACAGCHGKEGRATNQGYFPRIAGKPAGYLYNQLVNFREGRRGYPPMAYLVEHLSDAYLQEIASHFATLDLPYPPPQTRGADPALLRRGEALARRGDAARGLPACVACHGEALTGALPAFPGLLGLPRDYVVSQFGSWRTGQRKTRAPDCMAAITERLAPEDIQAVSTWLSSQPLPANTRPATTLAMPLPLDCGSGLK